MSHDFDDATEPSRNADGSWDTPIHERWDIMGNANGGYLMARVAAAMRAECGRRDPVTVTMHYLSPAPAGPARTECRIVKDGRRLAVVSGALVRDGRDLVRCTGVFGDVDASTGDRHVTVPPPDFPPFEECAPRESSPGAPPLGLMSRLDMRIVPEDRAFMGGGATGEARMRGWFTFRDGRPVDTLALLLAADSFPPTLMNLFGPRGWVPTVELTVHVRAVPVPGPIRCVFTTRVVQGGMCEEDGELWDASGTCVAMSRQLALAPLAHSE